MTVSLVHLRGITNDATKLRKWQTTLLDFETPLPSVGETSAWTAASTPGHGLTWFCADREPITAGQSATVGSVACKPIASVLSAHGCAANGTDCALNITVMDGATATTDSATTRLAQDLLALTTPKHLAIQATSISVDVVRKDYLSSGASNAIATIIVRSSDAVACWVVLTCAASGRFSENGFFVRPDAPIEIEFYAFEYGENRIDADELLDTLNATLRVEHLWPAMHLSLIHI